MKTLYLLLLVLVISCTQSGQKTNPRILKFTYKIEVKYTYGDVDTIFVEVRDTESPADNGYINIRINDNCPCLTIWNLHSNHIVATNVRSFVILNEKKFQPFKPY